MKKVLYSIGRTTSGQLIKAVDAEKGIPYACPICDRQLILRKGKKKRPHFAHKALSPNCTPESALHYGFKTLLFERIQACLEQQQPLAMRWHCSSCEGTHEGNLLKKATSVKLEHNLGHCQPDLALLDENNKVVAAIEIIVTHKPEEAALSYYKKNKIVVVSYELKSDEDLTRIDAEILQPDSIDACRNPKCPQCKQHMPKKKLLIIEGDCRKCSASMKVAALRGDMGYEGSLSDSDIQLAAQNGVFMKSQYSRTARSRYFASTCRLCGTFVGNHYLFTDYVSVSAYNRTEIEAGYYCPFCHD
ncbi:MAG: competence protein CoiA family protein [Cyanobacteria bacterium J06649_4]